MASTRLHRGAAIAPRTFARCPHSERSRQARAFQLLCHGADRNPSCSWRMIPTIRALCAFDDGITGPCLYAAGKFTKVGATPCKGLARWNGSSWQVCDSGILDISLEAYTSMTVYNDGSGPALVVTVLSCAEPSYGKSVRPAAMSRAKFAPCFHPMKLRAVFAFGRGFLASVFTTTMRLFDRRALILGMALA